MSKAEQMIKLARQYDFKKLCILEYTQKNGKTVYALCRRTRNGFGGSRTLPNHEKLDGWFDGIPDGLSDLTVYVDNSLSGIFRSAKKEIIKKNQSIS